MIVLTKPNSGRYRRWLGLSDPTEAAALAAGYDSIVHDFKCDDVDGGMCTLARLESAIKHLANEWAGSLPNDSPQLETSPPKSSANPDAARRRHFVRRDEAHASGGSGGDARQPKWRRSGMVAVSGGHAEGDQVPATAAAPLRLADAVGSAGSMVPIQGGSGPAGDMSRLAVRADHTKAADARAHDARVEHMRAVCTAEGEHNAHRLRLKAWVALRREQPERCGGAAAAAAAEELEGGRGRDGAGGNAAAQARVLAARWMRRRRRRRAFGWSTFPLPASRRAGARPSRAGSGR
jgi:hypothetical protein